MEKGCFYYVDIEVLDNAFYGVLRSVDTFVHEAKDTAFQRFRREAERVIRHRRHVTSPRVRLSRDRAEFLDEIQYKYALWHSNLEYRSLREVIMSCEDEGLIEQLQQYEDLLRGKGETIIYHCKKEKQKNDGLYMKLKAKHETTLATLVRMQDFLVKEVGLDDAIFTGFREGCIELYFQLFPKRENIPVDYLLSNACLSKFRQWEVSKVELSGHWVIDTASGKITYLKTSYNECLNEDSDSDMSADETRQYDCGHSEESKTKQPLLAMPSRSKDVVLRLPAASQVEVQCSSVKASQDFDSNKFEEGRDTVLLSSEVCSESQHPGKAMTSQKDPALLQPETNVSHMGRAKVKQEHKQTRWRSIFSLRTFLATLAIVVFSTLLLLSRAPRLSKEVGYGRISSCVKQDDTVYMNFSDAKVVCMSLGRTSGPLRVREYLFSRDAEGLWSESLLLKDAIYTHQILDNIIDELRYTITTITRAEDPTLQDQIRNKGFEKKCTLDTLKSFCAKMIRRLETDAEGLWSRSLLRKDAIGAHRIFDNITDVWSRSLLRKDAIGAHRIFVNITDVWSRSLLRKDAIGAHLIFGNIANVIRIKYLKLTYQDVHFVISYEKDRRRQTLCLPANISPCLLGLSRVGTFKNFSGSATSVYYTCNVKYSILGTFSYELRGDFWYQGAPFSLTSDVSCLEKLPQMVIAPIKVMVIFDPQSSFLTCGRNILHKNGLEIGKCYFINIMTQHDHETLVQVHLMKHSTFRQYIMYRFCSVCLLYSYNTEQNPWCPMLRANIFNCTVGIKFWNGMKLVHLAGAIGKPQNSQRNCSSGVEYVMQEGGESAVVGLHPLLSGGRQVFDNSTQVCRDSTAVKLIYVFGGGSDIVVARCVVVTISKVTTPPIRPELTQACVIPEKIKGMEDSGSTCWLCTEARVTSAEQIGKRLPRSGKKEDP